jgi:hypothetical protein
MSPSPDASAATREQVLRAVSQHFPAGERATVFDLLDQYGPEGHHRERERVHLAIVRLSRGDLDQLRKLVGYARRDYRDVLYWTELAQGYHDRFADGFTEAVLTPEATPSRLALLKETLPAVIRIAVLWNPGYISHDDQLRALTVTAQDLGVTLQRIGIRRPSECDGAFVAMRSGGAEALLVLTSTMLRYHLRDIGERALSDRLPAVGELREFAEAGGLLSYGPSAAVRHERAAGRMGHLIRTLRREPPAETPAGPRPLELVINLKAAGDLGLTIPPSVLARADEVIP